MDWKSALLKGLGQFGPKFQVEGDIHAPPTIFARIDSPVNALQFCRCMTVFIQRNFVANFYSSRKVHFWTENDHFAFLNLL